MQHFDISIAPGQARMIDVVGSYVYFLNGSAGGADATIALRNQAGSDEVLLKPGQAFNLEDGEENVRWVITNYRGEGTIIGSLLMGKGSFYDNRISGSVEVIDGGMARTLSNQAFMGYGNLLSSAAQRTHVQVWNPVGSGMHVAISRIKISSAVAQSFDVISNSAAMSTLFGNATSKLGGGAASNAEMRVQSSTRVAGPTVCGGTIGANQSVDVVFAEPFVLVPGTGLVAIAGGSATEMPTAFELVEKSAI